MKATPPELDRLTHALMSPLTTLQGTVQLLQRRLSNAPDEQQALLLAALGRNVQRLRTKLRNDAASGWNITTVWGVGYKFEARP